MTQKMSIEFISLHFIFPRGVDKMAFFYSYTFEETWILIILQKSPFFPEIGADPEII